jgi:hypothetical protein
MKMNKFFLTALFAAIFLTSCEPDEKDIDKYVPKGNFDSGALVLNEGSFNGGNASVSFISFDLNTTQNNIFSNENNGVALGDSAQSIAFKDDFAYIIVSVSDKIEVVNRYTLKKVATITGVETGRYMTFANGKGFVTGWGNENNPDDDFVAIINLTTNLIEKKISVSEGPERIVEASGKLFVSHKGGYGFGKTISVITSSSEALTNSINVGDVPSTMQVQDGSLWVLCEGNPSYVAAPLIETSGKLHKINVATTVIDNTYNFPNSTDHPSNLAIVNSKAYYTINSKVYKMSLIPVAPATTLSLPTTPAFTSSIPNLYGFAIKNNRIYISGFESFSGNGTALIYSLGDVQDSPAIGTLFRTTGVGVGPNGFYFNQ